MASAAPDAFAPGLPDRIMRKAQWRLLPLIFLAYLIAIIDRLNISFAATWLPSQPVFFSVLSETLHQRHRAVGIAAVNTFGQFGSFLSTTAFGYAKDTTNSYDFGLAAIAVCVIIGALILNHIRRQTAPAMRLPA